MTSPIQILLAEDNYPDVLYLKQLLGQLNVPYLLHVCEDGEQALAFLMEAVNSRRLLPDIVLLDIKLPKYSGLEVLEQIREIPQLNGLPVVIVTGSDDPDDLNRARSLRASYIKKPPNFEKLWQLMSVFEHACFVTNASEATEQKRDQKLDQKFDPKLAQPHAFPSGQDGEDMKLSVLLVEDNTHDIRLVITLLERFGDKELFEVEPVQDLASALTLIAQRSFDVVALDLGLPDSTGLYGFDKIQELAPDLPVVIVTGVDDQELGKEAVNRGAQDYVVKSSLNYGEILARSLKYAIHRKHAELMAKQVLLREHEILQIALAKAPIFVIRVDRQFQVIDVNAATEREFDRDRCALIGQSLLHLVPDIDKRELTNLFGAGVPFHILSHAITRTGTKLRNETYWDIMAWPVQPRDGLISEAILLAHDVTEKVLASQQRDEFVQTLAHDIRNPVLGEQRLLNALLEQYGADIQPAIVASALQEICKSNDSLVLMLSNLLEAYKFESDLYIPDIAKVNIARIISDCLLALKTLLMLSNISVVKEIPEDMTTIEGDYIAVQRLLLNIFHNAIKYTPAHGEIKISVRTENDRLIIAISDTGPGISLEEQANLFERFAPIERGKRRLHSSGLGLYICRRVVEAHHGEIKCTSELNQGTTFTINLPQHQGTKLTSNAI